MKIGILTYHHVVNDGAVLQAYAVAQCFKNSFPGAQVEIIDYRPFSTEMRDLRFVLKKDIAYTFENARRYLRFKSFINSNLPLSKNRLITNDYKKGLHFIEQENYDLIVVGSDEVWKIEKSRYARPFPIVYWLGENIKCKKIAFSASANKTFFEELSPEQKQFMGSHLNLFDLIGVRDQHTFNFLNFLKISEGKKIYYVPDPTFMLDSFPDRTREILSRNGVNFRKPLLGVMLSNHEVNKQICLYFKKRGYQIVALSFYSKYADINLCGALNPFEWAEIIKHFNFCITDRFHGTIFCLKNKVPFICLEASFDYKNYENKILSLLRGFDLTKQYISYSHHFNLVELENKINDVKAIFSDIDIDGKLKTQRELIALFMDKVKDIL